jgi:hypothetical protein
MDLGDTFDQVSARMRADLERARGSIKQRASRGGEFEAVFRNFLREYLPRSLDVSTGELIDATGRVTRQQDVIISDTAKTPVFYRGDGDYRVIPVEGAYAVIEVKARLDTAELLSIYENMLTVRRLEKVAYYKSDGPILERKTLYGQNWEIWPVNYFVFAYDSIDLATLAQRMEEKNRAEGLPLTSRIDTICVLDKGVICNVDENNQWDALPKPGTTLQALPARRSLLLFYALISNYLQQAGLPDIQFVSYVRRISFA